MFISMPEVNYSESSAPDPRDRYEVSINGHCVGVHAEEHAAQIHAQCLHKYLLCNEDPGVIYIQFYLKDIHVSTHRVQGELDEADYIEKAAGLLEFDRYEVKRIG